MLSARRALVVAALASCVPIAKGKKPMNTTASTPSFSDLMRLGRELVMQRVPEQSRQSLPVPMRAENAWRAAFLYAPAQILPGVNRLAAPNFVAYLDPIGGSLLELVPVTPKDFGLTDKAGELIGEFRLPQGMNANEYLLERERLFGLYANLVRPWLDGAKPGPSDLRLRAQEFLRSFAVVSEPPLIPYYHALGRDYFDWVRKIAKPT